MRKLLILIFLCACQSAFGEKHEVGLTLGGLLPQDRGINPNAIHMGAGTALQANYGRRLTSGPVEFSGEVHFLANPQRVVDSTNPAATRDVATIYVTPGIRLKFASKSSFSPYIAVGGGVAFYEQSLLQKDGHPNPAPRDISRGVFNFGGGVDTGLWRWIGLRAEIRDFYSGSPAYNLPGLNATQHNVVAGGGLVLKWGE
jgi:opacity protein-like surface antigen